MKKTVLFSLIAAAAVSAATTATDALAWNCNKASNVVIVNGFQDIDVGTWTCELDQFTNDHGYPACRYFVQWINKNFLPLAANLWIDEVVVPGHADCRMNSNSSFRTSVFNSPGFPSSGFDKFNSQSPITSLFLGTDGYSNACGVVALGGGTLYSICVKDV